jgi:FRG domain
MKQLKSWRQLVALEERFDRSGAEWVFRGQSSPAHKLRSTLERACADFQVKGRTIAVVEQAAMIEFKRSCHLYSPPSLPDDSDTLGWMALMRHYGAPSRLLDFTYSLFIATYFAAEAERARPVIWAVNKTWLASYAESLLRAIPPGRDGVDGKKLLEGLLKREGWAVDRLMFAPGTAAADGRTGWTSKDERPTTFAAGPLSGRYRFTKPFHDTLKALPKRRNNVLKIRIGSTEARYELLSRLQRTGLSRAALFPGLQGFAESLHGKILTTRRLERLRRAGVRTGLRVIGV